MGAQKKEAPVLSKEQEKMLRQLCDVDDKDLLSVDQLTKRVWDDQSIDGRDLKGRVVKEWMIKNGKQVKTTKFVAQGLLDLTQEQKEDIEKYSRGGVNLMDIVRTIFKNDTLTNLSNEARTVKNYIDNNIVLEPRDNNYDALNLEYVSGKYIPPVQIVQVVSRINKYLGYDWKHAELSKEDKDCALALKGYLNTYRFLFQINSYDLVTDRDSFEDAFIRYTYDKPDLSQEYIDQFVLLATDVVIAQDIQRRANILRRKLDEALLEDEKIPMTLNEAINSMQSEYNACVKRQDAAYKSLTKSRAQKLEERIEENASVNNLVMAWQQEKERNKLLVYAEKRKEAAKQEVGRITGMDHLVALVKGLTIDEAING